MPESTSLPEVVNAGVDAALEHVHTAAIAIVDTYDATTQRANLVSAIRQPLLDGEGAPLYEDFPTFESVPVIWPRGTQSGLHGPLVSGDSVLLVFLQIGIGEWRQSTGKPQDTADLRRHSEGYPVALAGLAPDAKPLLATTPDAWELGFFGAANGRIIVQSASIKLGPSASDFIALSSKVDAAIAAIQSKFDAHTHPFTAVIASGGSPVASVTSATATPAGVQPTTASTLVKSL